MATATTMRAKQSGGTPRVKSYERALDGDEGREADEQHEAAGNLWGATGEHHEEHRYPGEA